MLRLSLMLVVFVDVMGQGLILPIINTLLIDPSSHFLSADTSHGTAEEPYNGLIQQYARDGLSKTGHHGAVDSVRHRRADGHRALDVARPFVNSLKESAPICPLTICCRSLRPSS